MRLIHSAAAVLGVWLAFALTGRGADWSGIMRDEPAKPVDLRAEMERFFAEYEARKAKPAKGGVREEDGDHPRKAAQPAAEPQYLKAGTKFQHEGYWYTADGSGRGAWCESCNGVSYPDFVKQWNAKRTPPVSANPTRPGGSPGYTPGTVVQPAAGPVSTRYPASTGMAPTRTFAPGAVLRGVTSAGCATAGG